MAAGVRDSGCTSLAVELPSGTLVLVLAELLDAPSPRATPPSDLLADLPGKGGGSVSEVLSQLE